MKITDYPTVTVDDPLQEIFNRLRSNGTNAILLLDRRGRPYKWLRRGDMMRAKGSSARAGTLVHDTVTRDATLRDALEAVLTDNAGRVVVTGRRGEYTGVVDMETLLNSVPELLEADRLEAMGAQHELEEVRADRTHPEQEGGGGGLGVLITTGITTQRMPVLTLGSILTVVLALLVDWLASLAEVLLRPRGLEAGI